MTQAARYARLEAARELRGGRDATRPVALQGVPNPRMAVRSDYGVCRVWEGQPSRVEVLRTQLTAHEAEAVAGRMRDELTDEQVGQGQNVVARALKGRWARPVKVPRNFQGRRERAL